MQKKILGAIVIISSSFISTAIAIEPTSLPPTEEGKRLTSAPKMTKRVVPSKEISRKATKKFDPRRMERAEDEDDDERTALKKTTR